MSRESIGLLQRAYEAFDAGDFEPFFAMLDEKFVYRARDELPGGGAFVGPAAFRERIEALGEVFGQVRFEPQEFIDAGEHVIVALRQTARGRVSGVTLEQSISHVWLIRDGRGIELCVYSRREQALEAAGLTE
jgi:ketosteroid isomerase-like protein